MPTGSNFLMICMSVYLSRVPLHLHDTDRILHSRLEPIRVLHEEKNVDPVEENHSSGICKRRGVVNHKLT